MIKNLEDNFWNSFCLIKDSEGTVFNSNKEKKGYVAHGFFNGADGSYYHTTFHVVNLNGRKVWEYLNFEAIP